MALHFCCLVMGVEAFQYWSTLFSYLFLLPLKHHHLHHCLPAAQMSDVSNLYYRVSLAAMQATLLSSLLIRFVYKEIK